MSEGTRISWQAGNMIARELVALLREHCDRIEIAGSLRRMKADVGDIELVLIPKPEVDLFGETSFGAGKITAALEKAKYVLNKNGPYFKQVQLYNGLTCDIFLTTPEKWGVIFTLRTGSAEFSHRLVTARMYGGLCPSNLNFKDGRIWNGSEALDTPEEEDVFKALGLEWVEMRERG